MFRCDFSVCRVGRLCLRRCRRRPASTLGGHQDRGGGSGRTSPDHRAGRAASEATRDCRSRTSAHKQAANRAWLAFQLFGFAGEARLFFVVTVRLWHAFEEPCNFFHVLCVDMFFAGDADQLLKPFFRERVRSSGHPMSKL